MNHDGFSGLTHRFSGLTHRFSGLTHTPSSWQSLSLQVAMQIAKLFVKPSQ